MTVAEREALMRRRIFAVSIVGMLVALVAFGFGHPWVALALAGPATFGLALSA